MDTSTLIAVVSDIHAGSTVAVAPPVVHLDDGGTYLASKPQRWLYQCWQDYWDWIARLRDKHRPSHLYVVFNGDFFDGSHHGTTQLVSHNPVIQRLIAQALLEPVKSLSPSRYFVVRGTEAHVGASANSEESLARSLEAARDPDTGTSSWWHLKMEIQGRRLDIAHHGKMGILPWTRSAAVSRYAHEVFHQHKLRREPHPHLVLRGHNHKRADSGPACPTRAVFTGAWQLHTGWTHKKFTDDLADIGGAAVLIQDGRLRVFNKYFQPSGGSVWTEST